MYIGLCFMSYGTARLNELVAFHKSNICVCQHEEKRFKMDIVETLLCPKCNVQGKVNIVDSERQHIGWVTCDITCDFFVVEITRLKGSEIAMKILEIATINKWNKAVKNHRGDIKIMIETLPCPLCKSKGAIQVDYDNYSKKQICYIDCGSGCGFYVPEIFSAGKTEVAKEILRIDATKKWNEAVEKHRNKNNA